jgi:hypothetical protein
VAVSAEPDDARPENDRPEGVVTPEQPAPRLVRKIVCGYRQGFLPGEWLQTWRRLDRLLARSGLKVKALLEPLEELPADVDLLVIEPDLRVAAEAVKPPGVPILLTMPPTAASDFSALIQRLEAGTELTAERVDPAQAAGPTIVTYRGGLRID